MAKVAVVMGSKSDLSVVKSAVTVLKGFGIEVEVRVISAHRTPDEAHDFAKNAANNGTEVIICAAGKAAHLGGVMAAYTTLPVIGLPIKTDMMGGLDSLLSIVQMPSGIPVATVGVNGGENAGILAAQILGIKYPEIAEKLAAYKQKMKDKINVDDAAVQQEAADF
ncbi:MAG: 5-(carboxyamino)imidazole ribonucleotide mutase [Clostridia bacterium]|nr:5-(carboxyamino)imidazole ribonucleotide mutase [Clostridia bacterium]